MTLDEAIKHCEKVAEYNENELSHIDVYNAELAGDASRCAERAADHRQLAEWLTELKEAKRLLNLAVEDFSNIGEVNATPTPMIHPKYSEYLKVIDFRTHKWRYADEAEKLLSEEI